MQKRDLICVSNSLFSCFVINYTHFKKKGREGGREGMLIKASIIPSGAKS